MTSSETASLPATPTLHNSMACQRSTRMVYQCVPSCQLRMWVMSALFTVGRILRFQLLSPLADHNGYTVKNSMVFVDKLREVQTTPQDHMVSFDVKNLFTQVPIDEALRMVREKLTSDQTLTERTSIPAPQLVELVELCLRSSYFEFQGSFYEQVDGTALGSPLSSVIANLYMESLEETAIGSATFQPSLCVHCVDDMFVIWPHGQQELHVFHEHLNNQHPGIQFTMEEESGCKLPFFDVLMTKKDDRLLTSVYQKPTHTERYIPFNSHHHRKTIMGVLRWQSTDGLYRIVTPTMALRSM